MIILDPVKLNDWPFKKFLIVILAVQMSLIGVIGLDWIGFKIPIIRQLIGFIYVSFIPGFVILRVLRLHELDPIENLLYAVGMSLTFFMFLGFLINLFYPFIGISKPISLTPLITTTTALIIVFIVIAYIWDRRYLNFSKIQINIENSILRQTLAICLLPFMSIFGTHLVNLYESNIILLILILLLSIIPLFITSNKLSRKVYPIGVFITSISLLYHNSLISMFLWGADIHIEYYFSKLVLDNSLWNISHSHNINEVLSVVILAPIYSIFCDLNLIWVFKVIYPFLFSFVPLGLFKLFKSYTNDKIAFLSCFFFMSISTFYTEMLALARQQIAELFLVLLLIIILSNKLKNIHKSILLISFSASLVVSHYSLAYLFMFVLFTTFIILIIFDVANDSSKHSYQNIFSLAIIFSVLTLLWYVYISNSMSFKTLLRVLSQIITNLYSDFLNPRATQTLYLITKTSPTLLHHITKLLYLASQFFISIGILFLSFKKRSFKREYIALSIVFYGILVGSLILPYFARALNTTRLYHITLIVLSLFSILGFIRFLNILNIIIRKIAKLDYFVNEKSLKIISIFLTIFFLFNTGFVYEIAKDPYPTSISLSQRTMKESENIVCKKTLYNVINVFEADLSSANWLRKYSDNNLNYYYDYIAMHPLWDSMIKAKECYETLDKINIKENLGYIYLSYPNIKENLLLIHDTLTNEVYAYNTTRIYSFLILINNIYTNGNSKIFYN